MDDIANFADALGNIGWAATAKQTGCVNIDAGPAQDEWAAKAEIEGLFVVQLPTHARLFPARS